MKTYKIHMENGKWVEIDGEPCLQEYPGLELFVGYIPCSRLNDCKVKDDCITFELCGTCYFYKVSEVTTGSSMTPTFHDTKESAIDSARRIIEKFGVETVKKKMREAMINENK